MGKRTSYAPGTLSWVELSTTDLDAAKELLRRALRLGRRGQRDPRHRRRLLDEAGRRRHRRRDHGAAGAAARGGHPAELVHLRHRRQRRRRGREGEGARRPGPRRPLRRDGGRADGGRRRPDRGDVRHLAGGRRDRRRGRQRARGADLERASRTNDPDGAQAFYSGLFGWGFDKVDTGPDGPDYWTIVTRAAANGRNGGLRRRCPSRRRGVPPHWMPYFGVGVDRGRRRRRSRSSAARTCSPIDPGPGGRSSPGSPTRRAPTSCSSRATSTTER